MRTEINKTTNYGMFKFFTGNRPINPKHIASIVKSMQEEFLIKPIDVNENLEIIDGQHRFMACKQTGNPIYYIIHKGWGISEAHRLNANQRNWTTEQYIEGYCKMGYPEYIKFAEVVNDFPELGYSVIMSAALLTGSSICKNLSDRFRNGLFEFKDVSGTYQMLNCLMEVKTYYKGYTNVWLAKALFTAIKNKNFDFDEFMHKLAYQRAKLYPCTSIKEYLKLIEDIYNYKRRQNEIIRLT